MISVPYLLTSAVFEARGNLLVYAHENILSIAWTNFNTILFAITKL